MKQKWKGSKVLRKESDIEHKFRRHVAFTLAPSLWSQYLFSQLEKQTMMAIAIYYYCQED